jgi:hypothetical protein
VTFDPATWQRLEPLLLDPQLTTEPGKDRHLRMHFPANEPITFFFLGVPPPGRDSKDAEAWVHPAFLSLLLPLCVDVKVVASEASLPLLNGLPLAGSACTGASPGRIATLSISLSEEVAAQEQPGHTAAGQSRTLSALSALS